MLMANRHSASKVTTLRRYTNLFIIIIIIIMAITAFKVIQYHLIGTDRKHMYDVFALLAPDRHLWTSVELSRRSAGKVKCLPLLRSKVKQYGTGTGQHALADWRVLYAIYAVLVHVG